MGYFRANANFDRFPETFGIRVFSRIFTSAVQIIDDDMNDHDAYVDENQAQEPQVDDFELGRFREACCRGVQQRNQDQKGCHRSRESNLRDIDLKANLIPYFFEYKTRFFCLHTKLVKCILIQ